MSGSLNYPAQTFLSRDGVQFRDKLQILRRKLRSSFLVLLILLCTLFAAWAQLPGAGDIEGSVSDPTGAVVTGASVVARNTSTGATFKTATDNYGLFRFLVL